MQQKAKIFSWGLAARASSIWARIISSVKPRAMTAPPRSCPTTIDSPRKIAAIITAKAGTVNWNRYVRLGPRTFTTSNISTLAAAAGSSAQNRRSPRVPGWTCEGSKEAACQRANGSIPRHPRPIAHVAIRSGEWRRSIGVPKAT